MSKVKMPEPAVMTTGPGPDDVVYSFTGAQMEAFAAAKVREALELAARICDDRANQNELAISEDEPDEASSLRSAAWQMSVCARAIRALIPK